MNDDLATLTKLGAGSTNYVFDQPEAAILETFPNATPQRDYQIEFVHPEFTSLCPVTGQPDFGRIILRYVPADLCIESKSFKLYMVAFRNYGAFMETITNKVLDDLLIACSPRWMQVVGEFNARGGTSITVSAESGTRPR